MFGTAKEIKFNDSNIIFQRLSFVGELGWEIYIPINISRNIYLKLVEYGKKYGLVHAGGHALDIMRMEKGYLHWGHDISPEENQYEAGLGFAVGYKKNVDFIGKRALLEIKKKIPKKKFVMMSLKDNKPGFPLLLHDEPIFFNGNIIGRTTSGNYSFNFKKNIAFGYVSTDHKIDGGDIEIEVEKKRYKANIEANALHDPNNIIIKS